MGEERRGELEKRELYSGTYDTFNHTINVTIKDVFCNVISDGYPLLWWTKHLVTTHPLSRGYKTTADK